MIDYIDRKRSTADSLAESDYSVPDEDLIGYLLTGLDSSYASFATAFMMKSDHVSVDDLVGFLLQEEARMDQDNNRHAQVLPSTVTPSPHSSVLTTNRSSPRSYSHSNHTTIQTNLLSLQKFN